MPLGALIIIAYDVTVRQISGPQGPLSERYDIAATTEHPVKAGDMLARLRALLAERFHLVVRRETRDVPVLALTVAKGGPKLRPGNPPESPGPRPRTPALAGGIEVASGHLMFKDESMADFAWALSRMTAIGDNVVVDQTGLKGNYDFELTFERETPLPAGADPHEPAAPRGPSIFAAVQEQLGLKLESRKAPVEFVVVERAEKPTEN
jgi:uncharacterized protein (TIGR03435 family)